MKTLALNQMENVQGGNDGPATVACISDVYSNHGWESVAAWVITGFAPEFGLGVAIGCAIK